MRLTEINLNDIPNTRKAYKSTKILSLLMEFKNSDMTAARIDGAEYKSAYSGAQSIRKSVKRFNIGGIIVAERQGNIYLLKEE